jgi:hypothetical protein
MTGFHRVASRGGPAPSAADDSKLDQLAEPVLFDLCFPYRHEKTPVKAGVFQCPIDADQPMR